MSREERDDAGRYAEVVSPDDVLGVFDRVEGPVVTSGDVADALGCSRETARRKLRALGDAGDLASRETAGRVVWWRAASDEHPADVDPDDPFWTFEPGASGKSDVSEHADEHLYGGRSA